LRTYNGMHSETDGTDFEEVKHAIMRFDWFVVDNPNFRVLDFTLPSEELMKLDLNEIYANALNGVYDRAR
jgi:hypothetical protein